MPGLRQAFASFMGGIPALTKLNPFAKGSLGGPLDLWNAEQVTKLKNLLSPGVGSKGMIGNWWAGRTFQGLKANSAGVMSAQYSAVDPSSKFVRRAAASGLGALAAMNIMDIDPLSTATIGNEVMTAAGHIAVAGTSWKMGGGWKAAGLGYVGLGAVNLMRPGNNMGPY